MSFLAYRERCQVVESFRHRAKRLDLLKSPNYRPKRYAPCSLRYKPGAYSEKGINLYRLRFSALRSNIGLPDFYDSFLQVVEFFEGDFSRFFLQTELVCGRAVDQVRMLEYMGGVFVHGAGLN